MMGGIEGMGWGMGWSGLLIVALVVLGVAALAKYLFFNSQHDKGRDHVLLSWQNASRRFR